MLLRPPPPFAPPLRSYPAYDFWMGRELNPRLLGGAFDLKEFCELYPGMMGEARGWGVRGGFFRRGGGGGLQHPMRGNGNGVRRPCITVGAGREAGSGQPGRGRCIGCSGR